MSEGSGLSCGARAFAPSQGEENLKRKVKGEREEPPRSGGLSVLCMTGQSAVLALPMSGDVEPRRDPDFILARDVI
jgi:hypothetical protein